MKQIFIFLIFSFPVFGQTSLESYISKYATEVNSLSFSDTNYKDLEALGVAIKDYSVVMLGEMWHGDGATFEAKSRIVRYLHDKKGFNVLAFESGFYSLTKGFDELSENGPDFDTIILRNIYSHWSQTKQCQVLFEFIKHNPTIRLCGIDNQLKGKFDQTTLRSDLQKFIESSKVDFLNSDYYKKQFWADFNTCIEVFMNFSWNKPVPYDKSTMRQLSLSLDTIAHNLKQPYISSNEFQNQVLLNVSSLCKMFLYLDNFDKASCIRDEQMSMNLEWIVKKKYPKEKVIVWLASSHMVKDNQQAYQTPQKQVSMGYFYSHNKSNPDFYAIGFTSNSGHGHTLGNESYKIPRTKPRSIECAFKGLDKPYLFVSLTKYQSDDKEEFLFSKIDGGNNQKALWHKSVDGIFYINIMTPAMHK